MPISTQLTTDRTGRFLAYSTPVITDNAKPSAELLARFRAAWDRVSGH